MTSALLEFPELETHGVPLVFSELRDECASFSEFVEEIFEQLEALRAQIDRRSQRLDLERESLSQELSELQQRQIELLEAPAVEIDTADERVQDLEEQRDELEQELELVRRRAVELSDSLSRQQHDMAEERSEWTGELKEMRQVLERQNRMFSEPEIQRTPVRISQSNAVAAETDHAGSTEDPVINSVMAQFAKLQKDAAARRMRA